MCMSASALVCICVHVSMCAGVSSHVCVCVCVYVHTHIYVCGVSNIKLASLACMTQKVQNVVFKKIVTLRILCTDTQFLSCR